MQVQCSKYVFWGEKVFKCFKFNHTSSFGKKKFFLEEEVSKGNKEHFQLTVTHFLIVQICIRTILILCFSNHFIDMKLCNIFLPVILILNAEIELNS